MDLTELFNTYLHSWRIVNPITMLELMVFGYMERKFSLYVIEKACRIDIRFMWLLEGEPTFLFLAPKNDKVVLSKSEE